jgi:hypothetical protein
MNKIMMYFWFCMSIIFALVGIVGLVENISMIFPIAVANILICLSMAFLNSSVLDRKNKCQ